MVCNILHIPVSYYIDQKLYCISYMYGLVSPGFCNSLLVLYLFILLICFFTSICFWFIYCNYFISRISDHRGEHFNTRLRKVFLKQNSTNIWSHRML